MLMDLLYRSFSRRYIPSDLYVRFLRSKGEDVKFISGTDEHGVPITIKARDEKISSGSS